MKQLFEDCDAFLQEHRRCGELDAVAADPEAEISRIWMACSCGAFLNRAVPPVEPVP